MLLTNQTEKEIRDNNGALIIGIGAIEVNVGNNLKNLEKLTVDGVNYKKIMGGFPAEGQVPVVGEIKFDGGAQGLIIKITNNGQIIKYGRVNN